MWIVAVAKPGQTQLAIVNLKRQQFNYYAPKFKRETIRNRKLITVEQFLFSNYLFVEVFDRWRTLSYTYGIGRVLLDGNDPKAGWRAVEQVYRPEPVAESIILELKSREVDGYYQFDAIPDKFKQGQTLRATAGLLEGKLCICEHHTAIDRVKILFTGLGFSFRTEMNVDQLEVA